MTKNQKAMLVDIANGASEDVQLLLSFGPQWKRTANALSAGGLVTNSRAGWRVTDVGRTVARKHGAR